DAALAIGAELALETQLQRVLDAALALVGADGAQIALQRPSGSELEIVASRGEAVAEAGARVPLEGHPLGTVASANLPLRASGAAEAGDASPARSWLGIPLSEGGKTWGAMS